MCKKLAVMFPGIGYHCDKPLLYYSKKLCASKGYEIKEIAYGKLPRDRFAAFDIAWKDAKCQLDAIDFSGYEDILFISKSIGTVIAAKYSREILTDIRNVYMTPLLETMEFAASGNVAFHGNKDPLVDTEELERLCGESGVKLYIYEGGNHSIETENISHNIEIVADIITKIQLMIS